MDIAGGACILHLLKPENRWNYEIRHSDAALHKFNAAPCISQVMGSVQVVREVFRFFEQCQAAERL